LQSKERESAIGGKIYKFEEGLARWCLKPEDIDIVIHTHLHNDYFMNLNLPQGIQFPKRLIIERNV